MRKMYLQLLVYVAFATVANGQINYFSKAALAGINPSEMVTRGPHVQTDYSIFKTFACDPPTGITVTLTSPTTASVSFTSAGNNFIVEYGPTGFTPGTGASAGTNGTIATGTSSPIGIAGLTASTTYDLYIRQVCAGPVYGDNSTPAVIFTSLCNPVNVPYSENFDGATPPVPPACISVTNNNGDGSQWVTSNQDAASAPNSMYIEWNPSLAMNDWFFTKGLNLNGGTAYRITFKYKTGDLDNHEKLKVMFGTAPAAAFMTTVIHDYTDIYEPTNYVTETWDFIPPSVGIYYIGFQGYSDANKFYIVVDDISVNVTPPCAPPTSISVVPTGPTSASASFISGGTSYIVEYGPTGFTPGVDGNPGDGGTIVTGTSSPIAITGMTGGPAFDLYIRQACGVSTYGANSPVNSFVINDEAVGAVTLTVGAACSGASYTNLNATKSANEVYPSCSGTATAPVWFKFTAPASGAVRISTDVGTEGLFDDSKIGLFTASDPNNYSTFQIVSCDDDGGTALGLGYRSVIYATGLSGTYYIAVDKYDEFTSSDAFCITVEEINSSMLATVNDCTPNYQTPSGSNASYTGWQPLLDLNSKLIALVRNPAGGAVSSYSVSQYINLGAVRVDDVTTSRSYLNRNFTVNNPSATNVDVQFFFLNSELLALRAVDSAATINNLGVTRQNSLTCQSDFVAANGTTTYLAQTSNGISADGLVRWVQVNTPGLSNFFLNTSKASTSIKILLQGACPITGSVTQHRPITSAWANVLNTYALVQPYDSTGYDNYSGPSYGGKEHVNPGFFTATGSATDILDWVLLELRNGNPGTVVARRAAFVRVDGQVVDLDGTSAVSFRGVPSGSYYLDVRHRNHLGIRSSVVLVVDGSLGNSVTTSYNFTTSQGQAYQNGTITTNPAMKALTGGLFALWGGNANGKVTVVGNGAVRASGPPNINDFTYLFTTILAGSTGPGMAGVYNTADVNLDGTVRASGPPTINDFTFLFTTVLAGSTGVGFTQHR